MIFCTERNDNKISIMKEAVESKHPRSVVRCMRFGILAGIVVYMFLGVFLSKTDDLIALVIFTMAIFYIGVVIFYFNRRYVKVKIRDKMIECEGIILPFIRKVIWANDVEYFVTRETDTSKGRRVDLLLIKCGKIVQTININPGMMLNAREVIDALPWPNRGRYIPDSLDYFKMGTINEKRIIGN